MALLAVKDAAGNTVYLDATGAGTGGDPYVVRHGGVVGVSGVASVQFPSAQPVSWSNQAVGVSGTPSVQFPSAQPVSLSNQSVGVSGVPTVQFAASQTVAATLSNQQVGVSGAPSVRQSGPWAVGLSGVAVNSPPAAVSSGNPTVVPTDFQGRLLAAQFPPEASVDGTVQLTNAATNATVIAAPSDGQRIYVSTIVISNQGADTEVCIKDGTTARLYLPAPSGGAVLPIPDRLRLTANSALTASGLTPTTSLRVSAVGVKWA